ncbi:TPA: helix-turn-helix transcriptional regulator [Legionella pneumophila]
MTSISEELLKHKFSLNMRRLMASKSISENELSKITEISQSAINRIKNGQVCPSLYQACLIADALESKIEDIITDVPDNNVEVNSNYIPVLSANNLLENVHTNVLGFIENTNDCKKNIIGLKVDKTFDCKILSNDSIVMALLDDNPSYSDGDTILFVCKKKYMIGTIHQGIIKPIDNLLMQIDLKNSAIVGKVIGIETKFIKEKDMVFSILEKFNIDCISTLLTSITKTFDIHHV